MPHHDPASPAGASVESLLRMNIPKNSLVVGVSLGGLVAAKLQECGRGDPQVIAINSPTWANDVVLESSSARRLAFYSSQDSVIASRVGKWSEPAGFSRDFDRLTHDTDSHARYIARIFDWYIQGMLPRLVDQIRSVSRTQQETDEIVWRLMAYEHGAGTIRAVARKWGLHCCEVRRALASAMPAERKRPQRVRPKLVLAIPFIDAILEADRNAPRNQRHTAHRIWTRLRCENPEIVVGESTVRE